ncbi:uncharacterized protein LOC109833311 isoform X3 [Asparagus officinalis]|nr:uncharacterized protein LOC109833311 isoform X3 [Asparagus officinalis]
MTNYRGKIICFSIIIIDIAAGILGLKAEIAEHKGTNLSIFLFECKAPMRQAYKLGLAAAVLLVLAHAVANLLGGCTCICSREEFQRASADRQMAVATLSLSWLVLAAGFTLLMIGAVSNSQSRASCILPHPHFLATGGSVCFVHGLFGMAYYVSAAAASLEEEQNHRRDESLGVRV